MIKKSIVFIWIIVPILSNAQMIAQQDSLLNIWIKATINIECVPSYEMVKNQIRDQVKTKDLTWEQGNKIADSIMFKSETSTGTALFISYHNKYYLVTARHVLADVTAIDSNSVFFKIMLIDNASMNIENKSSKTIDNFGNRYVSDGDDDPVLMSLSSGFYERSPYILSTIADDIGIISLNFYLTSSFFKTLIKRGYKPVEINDAELLQPVDFNKKIIAIGFPIESISNKNIDYPNNQWESNTQSYPILTEGSLVDKKTDQNHLFGSIFVYNGYSGGPVLQENRLIGIVSQKKIELKKLSSKSLNVYGIYYSYFVKSSQILKILKMMEIKNKYVH